MFDEKEYRKQYYLENKEKLKAKATAWAKANPEKRAAFNRTWKKANPENKAAENRRYYLKLKLMNAKVSQRTMNAWSAQVRERDCYTCRDCGATENLEAHHIFSKSKHPDRILEIDNGTTLCEPCHKYEHKINGEI
tara:strand:+ start:2600 stop:3007 length:408 start_codon:yes stop_codon:yes gene_type:complete